MEGFAIEIESPIEQRGRTTSLYKARDVIRKITVAIKEVEIKDTQENHKEIDILEHLRGSPNIINLLGSVTVGHTSRLFLTFEYIESTSWEDIQELLSSDDLQNYMHQLFKAINACHNRKIIHRNIKPENLLINHGKRHLKLIGWGQAVYHHLHEADPLNTSTYEYMSPELLLNGPSNGYSVDLWSAGCILASTMFRQKELFNSGTQGGQLIAVAKILGSGSLMRYARTYNVEIDPSYLEAISGFQGKKWRSFISSANRDIATDEAINLLNRLLVVDPFKRFSVKQALSHSYLARRPRARTWNEGGGSLSQPNKAVIPSTYFNCEFSEFIGEGTFGRVFKMTNKSNWDEFAVKVMKRKGDKNLTKEIWIMEKLRGAPNVIKYYGSVRDNINGFGVLVFEYAQFTEWRHLYKCLRSPDIQHYIYQLLLALDACHSIGIMHRDVKPSNVLINPSTRNLRLIDFGQAIQYLQGMEYSIAVGTLQYKSPELLLGYQQYDYAVDMWSVGCMLGSAIFRKRYLFPSENKKEALLQITGLVGSEAMLACFRRYNNDTFSGDLDFENIQRKEWSSFVTGSNRGVVTKQAIDLISKLLVCQPEMRLTAKQALEHNYFKRVPKLPKVGDQCKSAASFTPK